MRTFISNKNKKILKNRQMKTLPVFEFQIGRDYMAKRKKKAAKKYYIMKSGRKSAIFTGRQPRQAALKAATRGFKDIKLRERGRRNKDGTYTVHKFKGSMKKIKLGDDRPEWLPEKVRKPVVKKVGIERINKI